MGSDRQTESPGLIDEPFLVPPELTGDGEHLIAIRISNFHYDLDLATYFQGLDIDDYGSLVVMPLRTGTLMLLPLGAVMVVAVYYFLLFALKRRQASYLLFSLVSAATGVLLAAEAWRWVLGYTYEHHVTRLLIQSLAAATIGGLLPVFFLAEFSIRARIPWSIATMLCVTAAVALPESYDLRKVYALTAGLLISTAVVLVAAGRRHPGWMPALFGLLPCLLLIWWSPTGFGELWFFFGFSALALGMLMVLVLRMREEDARAKRSVLRSAQLEVQLLKRSIEPHFLMNTLTSILEWVEIEPNRAARFIEALADEMRLMSGIAGETLIPFDTEVRLCQSHLSVMSLRHEVVFGLRVSGASAGDLVPPAIFHTLIENALTHGTFTTGHPEFVLKHSRTNGLREYRLLSPETAPMPAKPQPEGTGLRYVRARLEESFPGRWRLEAGARSEGWETVIQIRDDERTSGTWI